METHFFVKTKNRNLMDGDSGSTWMPSNLMHLRMMKWGKKVNNSPEWWQADHSIDRYWGNLDVITRWRVWANEDDGVVDNSSDAMMASWPIFECWANLDVFQTVRIVMDRWTTHQTHWWSAGSWSASSQCSCTCRSPAVMSSLSFSDLFVYITTKKFKGTYIFHRVNYKSKIVLLLIIMIIVLTVHPLAVVIETRTPFVHFDFLGEHFGVTWSCEEIHTHIMFCKISSKSLQQRIC